MFDPKRVMFGFYRSIVKGSQASVLIVEISRHVVKELRSFNRFTCGRRSDRNLWMVRLIFD